MTIEQRLAQVEDAAQQALALATEGLEHGAYVSACEMVIHVLEEGLENDSAD